MVDAIAQDIHKELDRLVKTRSQLDASIRKLEDKALTREQTQNYKELFSRFEAVLFDFTKTKGLFETLLHPITGAPPSGSSLSPLSIKQLGTRRRTLSSPVTVESTGASDLAPSPPSARAKISLSSEASVPLPSIASFDNGKRPTVTVHVPMIGGNFKSSFPEGATVASVKSVVLKKLGRSGVQNVRPDAYFIQITGQRVFDEDLIFSTLICDSSIIELIRPFEFELNFATKPLPKPIVVTENMDVQKVANLLGKALHPDGCKSLAYRLFRGKEELEPRSKSFVSFGLRVVDTFDLCSVDINQSVAASPAPTVNPTETNPKKQTGPAATPRVDPPTVCDTVKIVYSPYDDLDAQKKTKVYGGWLYKQTDSGKWQKRWFELDKNQLSFYASEGKDLKGVISLKEYVAIVDANPSKKKAHEHSKDEWFYFDLEIEKTVSFRTKEEKMMNNWMKAIHEYCALLRAEQVRSGPLANEHSTPSASEKRKKPSLARSISKGKLPNYTSSSGKHDRSALVSAPFMTKKLFSVSTDWKWSSDQNPLDTIQFLEVLGVGACGKVLKAKHKQLEFILAVKIVAAGDKQLQEELESEMEILKKCRSTNVIAYYGTVLRETETWILMDYCGVGSVKDLIKMTGQNLTEDKCRYVIQGTLQGLVYMHGQNILHLDIKAANILLTEDCVVKLADFGVSTVLKQTNEVLQKDDYVGSPLFMAPEVIKKEPINNRADIWSLGIAIIEMAQGRPPNLDINSIEKLPLLAERDPPTLKKPKDFSPEFNQFLTLFLVKAPSKRPSAADLLAEPFVINSPYGPEVLKAVVEKCMAINTQKRVKIDEETNEPVTN